MTTQEYNIQDTVKTDVYQLDINLLGENLINREQGFWAGIHFLILSGFQDPDGNGIFNGGYVIMNGTLRYLPTTIKSGQWLAINDVQLNPRPTKLPVETTNTYTSFQCSVSNTNTGFPQITGKNIQTFRGSVNGSMIQKGTITGSSLSPTLVLPSATTCNTPALTDNSQLVANTNFIQSLFDKINIEIKTFDFILSNYFRFPINGCNVSIIYKNILFFAGNNGTVISTTNGVDFNTLNSGTTKSLFTSIIFNNELYFAGEMGRVIKTSDGVNFTVLSSGITNPLYTSIIFNNELFFAGGNGRVISTSDGVNFTTLTSGDSSYLSTSIIFNTVLFFAGNSGTVISTVNGINFTTLNSGTTSLLNTSIIFNNVLFFAGSGGKVIKTSDGVNFTVLSSETTKSLSTSIIYNDVLFFAGSNGIIIFTRNGVDFQIFNVPSEMIAFNFSNSIIYKNELYINGGYITKIVQN